MTYSVCMTCSAPLRMRRTKLGTVAIPMATIATRVDPPKIALSMMASSSAGKASNRSLVRIITSLVHRPVMAAMMPSGTPMTVAMPTATTPTKSVVRDPMRI